MRKSIKNLVKNKSYLSYFFATSLSMGVSNILQFTLALYILEKTTSPIVYASILSIIVIPRVLLTPISGVVGDRLKRIDIMKTLNIFQVLVLGIYAFYSYIYGQVSVTSIYILVIILEMVEVFYNSAESSILSEIVEKEFLEEAVTLSRVDDGIVFITTPLISAFIYKNFGIFGSFLLVSILLTISLVLNFLIDTPYSDEIKKKKLSGIKSFVTEFMEGINELKNDKYSKVFVIVAPIINFSFSAIFSVVITYVFLEVFKTSEYIYGVYRMVTASISLFLPFLILPIIKNTKPIKLLKYSAVSISCFLFLIGLCVYYGMVAGGNILLVVGLITLLDCLVISSVMPLNIATQVFFQKNIKNEFRSRIMSVFRMLTLSSIPLGNMFYGLLSSIMPAYICILIASLAVLIAYPIIIFISKQ